MDEAIINGFFSKIGKTFYQSPDFFALEPNAKTFYPIARFGMGVLSSFMVASSLHLDTRRRTDAYVTKDPVAVIIEAPEALFWFKDGKRVHPGTTTTLSLRNVEPWSDITPDDFVALVSSIMPRPRVSTSVNGVELSPKAWNEILLGDDDD